MEVTFVLLLISLCVILMKGDFSFIRITSAMGISYTGSEKFCSIEKLLMYVSCTINNTWSLAKFLSVALEVYLC